MSRSYKHQLVRKQGYGTRHKQFAKNRANRHVRRFADEIADGSSYRKLTNPYNIDDWVWRYDPRPRVSYVLGYPKVIEPDPVWQWRRK